MPIIPVRKFPFPADSSLTLWVSLFNTGGNSSEDLPVLTSAGVEDVIPVRSEEVTYWVGKGCARCACGNPGLRTFFSVVRRDGGMGNGS